MPEVRTGYPCVIWHVMLGDFIHFELKTGPDVESVD
jgi:hypothetical protein